MDAQQHLIEILENGPSMANGVPLQVGTKQIVCQRCVRELSDEANER